MFLKEQMFWKKRKKSTIKGGWEGVDLPHSKFNSDLAQKGIRP